MTIIKAFDEFTKSVDFKNIARVNDSLGSKYRIYLSRFKSDTLKAGAMVELLIANGYAVTANKATKRIRKVN